MTIRTAASVAPKTCRSPGPGMTGAPLSPGGKAAVCAGGVIEVCGGFNTGGFKTGATLSVFGGDPPAGGGVRVGAAGPDGADDELGASFGADSGVAVAAGAAGGDGAGSLADGDGDGDGGGLVVEGATGGGSSAAGTALTRSGRARPPDDR